MTRKEAEKLQVGDEVRVKGQPQKAPFVVADRPSYGDPIWFALRHPLGEVLLRNHWALMRAVKP